jgi:putative nucleotidyltransferase with HDIG domain
MNRPDVGGAAVLEGKPNWWDPRLSGEALPAPPSDVERALSERVERQIAFGKFEIPQVPAIAVEAMALLARTDAEIAAVAVVVSRDQRLAADLLSYANSALYTGAARAANIPQALMRVGTRRARSLILSACLKGAMYSGAEAHRAQRLWRHSCAAAAAAAQIARNLGLPPDDLYLGGLFHDVGKIVVLKIIDDVVLRSQASELRPRFVDGLLERLHEPVGAEIVLHWGLPDEIVDVVQHHDESRRDRLTLPQAIVAVADHCCSRLGVGATEADIDDCRPVAGLVALKAFGVGPDAMGRLLDGVREAIQDMETRNAEPAGGS